MATFSAAVAASADDARQVAGTVTVNGSLLQCSATTDYVGMRFLNVTIAAGSTVSAATVDVYVPNLTYDDPDVDIYGEDADDAAAFTTAANNISSRTPTTATVAWTATGISSGWKTTPDIASVVQEIVSRGGWVSGNDMAIIFKGRSTDALRWEGYDGGTGNYATLNVTYTTGGGLTKQAIYYAQMRA